MELLLSTSHLGALSPCFTMPGLACPQVVHRSGWSPPNSHHYWLAAGGVAIVRGVTGGGPWWLAGPPAFAAIRADSWRWPSTAGGLVTVAHPAGAEACPCTPGWVLVCLSHSSSRELLHGPQGTAPGARYSFPRPAPLLGRLSFGYMRRRPLASCMWGAPPLYVDKSQNPPAESWKFCFFVKRDRICLVGSKVSHRRSPSDSAESPSESRIRRPRASG